MTDAPKYPVIDEITGEVVSDPDGQPIAELAAEDYFGLADRMSIEERAAGERAWRFGHVIVDEAQDLTPMQWRMIARRARGHSMTIVGDLAQRSLEPASSWEQLLPPELGTVERFDLTTNYRSPREISELASQVLAELVPDLPPSIAIRTTGVPPMFTADSLEDVLSRELVESDGRVAVIGVGLTIEASDRLSVLTPIQSKGMEFDSVVVVEPADILDEPNGMSLLYVAITRSTERLTIVHDRPLPKVLTTSLG